MLKSPSQSSALMMTRKVTQVTLLVAIVILLAGGAGLYLLNNKIGDAQKVEASREAEVGSNKQVASRYQMALTGFNQSESHLQHLEASLPENQYVPTLVEQVQSLAKSTNLVVQTLRPSPITQAMAPAPPKPVASGDSDDAGRAAPTEVPLSYSTMSLDLTVDGDYAHIMRFIYDLPHFPKIISVQSLSLHPAQNGQIDARMTVTAYVFDPTQDITISQPLSRVLQQNEIPLPPSSDSAIAGGNVQAALVKTGFMTPEARAVGVARSDAAIADEQAKGQGILEPSSDSAPATPSGQGGMR